MITTINITGQRIIYSMDVTPEQVLRVYAGRTGRCMCGCSGRYWSPACNREAAGASRGYPLEDVDVNDKQVRKILRTLATAPRVSEETGLGAERVLFTTLGERDYVAYLKA